MYKLYIKKVLTSRHVQYIMYTLDIGGIHMADMGTREASEKWGVSQQTVQRWCREGKIAPNPTQDRKGSPWHIPKDAVPPLLKNK